MNNMELLQISVILCVTYDLNIAYKNFHRDSNTAKLD